jgi:hypothetical protein
LGIVEAQALGIPVSAFTPIGLAEESGVEKLQARVSEIVRGLGDQLDEVVSDAISAPTLSYFQEIRKKLFPVYVKFSLALSSTITSRLELSDLPRLIDASFAALEAEFAPNVASYFADDVYHEILFSLSALRSANRWIPQLIFSKVDESQRLEDSEIARQFNAASMWSYFHLDCLRMVVKKNESVDPAILQELLDGLRSSVMAYAHVRTALACEVCLNKKMLTILLCNGMQKMLRG